MYALDARFRLLVCCTLWAAGAGLAPSALAGDTAPIVLEVRRAYTVAGDPIDNAMILVVDGRIASIGAGVEIPDGAHVLEIADGVATPGLIDASCALDFEIPEAAGERRRGFWELVATYCEDAERHDQVCTCGGPPHELPAELTAAGQSPWSTWAEQAAEVTPHLRVLDAVNLLSNDFKRLARDGVTTVFVSPDSASVIGARGAIVKTAGPLAGRVVRGEDAVKATMGSDPSRRGRRNQLPPRYGPAPSFHTRRPTTRMGVDFVFRKALYDARLDERGGSLHGADTPPLASLPVLREILAGRVPLRIQARMQHDIFSALRLADEFGLRFTLEEAIEAYQCLPQLAAANVPVIFGPIYMDPAGYRARSGEARDPRLDTPARLRDAGVTFALTAQELRDEEGLARQAMFAVRYGLSEQDALRAVTVTPAELMNLSDQLGTLEPGKAADVVVWSGEPFEPTSRVMLVLIDGGVVYGE